MSSRSAMIAPFLTTLLGPFCILAGAWYGGIGSPLHEEVADRAAEIDAQIDEALPEVVILGNSMAEHGIDPDALATGLELRSDEVLSLT